MCGILGRKNKEKKLNRSIFDQMLDTLAHRGPDGRGVYTSQDGNVFIGHRRLSLIDLSEKGSQPMHNENRTIWLTANGEIYNYAELKNILQKKGHLFSSKSDSEVIIHGYEEWGTDVLLKLKGMFAFGLWDENKKQLFIARDRFGIKPLYYYYDNNEIIFSSEIKGIIEDKKIKREIDFSSFSDYFVYRYIPSPKTIWKNIYKVPPAHFIVFNQSNEKFVQKYWNLEIANNSLEESSAIDKVDEMLRKSVMAHTLSDVPVGAFLSGGYDSSALVYYLSQSKYPTQTFSLGFENWKQSEHKYAECVSDIFKTSHKNKIIGLEEYTKLDKLMFHYDDPIADISIIPTFSISELASQSVKAVVSGEGADEIFSGYTWHRNQVINFNWKNKIDYLKNHFINNKKEYSVNDYSSAMAMGLFDKNELKKLLHPDLHHEIPENPYWFYQENFNQKISGIKSYQYLDIKTFMAELVLTKVDRASMAHSLEVRVPFLDHELVEFMFRLSEKTYIKKNYQKFLLYKNICSHLPESILKRPKQGFVGPDCYYQNITWYKSILQESNLISDKIINKTYTDHLIKTNDHWRLWKIAVMEKWYSLWKN